MSTSKGANTYNRQNWEESEFPLVCQTCLGDNPFLRMMKEKHGKECKTCNRPFTVFRWCSGARIGLTKTKVCQTCSQEKHICQTCLLDLEYEGRNELMSIKDPGPGPSGGDLPMSQPCTSGSQSYQSGLPVQVRDAALRVQDSDVNKEYYTQKIEKEIENSHGTNQGGAPATKGKVINSTLRKSARTIPYRKRNRPHICSFWVKGECKRGEECPYRHEKPTDPDDPLADQNIRDRFYGTNDPVADKLLRRYHDMPKPEPPEDKTNNTVYISGLGKKVDRDDLKNHFCQFGEIRSVNVVQKQYCAFVQFTDRSSAEFAIKSSSNRLIIKGQRLNIQWSYPSGQQQSMMVQSRPALTMPPEDTTKNYFNLPPPPMMPPCMGSGGPMPGPRPMYMPGPGPSGGNFQMRPPFGMNMRPSGPPSYQSGRKMQPQHPPPPMEDYEFPHPSRGLSNRPRESGGVVKPFGAGLKYPSQDPNRMGQSKR